MKQRLGPGTLLAIFLNVLLVCGSYAATYSHTFEFDARKLGEKPTSVALAGSFNGWSKDATPMKDRGDGVWTATLNDLPEGVAYYKFVINGNKWVNDPNAEKDLEIDDNYGGRNSGVVIGPDIRKAPPPLPNHINKDAIRFDPKDSADVNVFARGQARFRIRVQHADVEGATVLASPYDRGQVLSLLGSEGGYDAFGGTANFDASEPGFVLLLRDGDDVQWLDKSGLHSAKADPQRPNHFDLFPLASEPKFTTPAWARDAVWYQIFPERFRNGDPSNDPGGHDYENHVKWTANWWKTQPGEKPGAENFYKGVGNVWKRRYGGDIQGIRQELPYLRSLGVNAIYLNPIFEADSMHKYDTTDYRHIDDNFGKKGDASLLVESDDPSTWQWSQSDKIFLDFVADAHRQGFKVILDGVFNHVGTSHPFFQDVLKNGKNSKYANWFEITDWTPGKIQYKAWDGPNGHLPVLKKDPVHGLADGPRQHVLAIVKRWLAPDGDPSRGIDGWRLDVPGDIPHPFWVEFRKVVKQTKPDAYITGEIWDWAQPWLGGDQFDAVMNYRFAVACQDFFVNQRKAIDPAEFNQRLNKLIYAYPLQVVLVQQNLFDSHDTDRFASMFVNPDLPFDASNRIEDNGPNYKPDKPNATQRARMIQAVQFQMSFIGAPMIYYGDEAGMWGPDDPSNRQPMIWRDLEPYDDPQVKFNDQVFGAYQRAIAARATLPALRDGFFHAIKIDDSDSVYAFERDLNDQRVYVILNRSATPHAVQIPVADQGPLVNWLDASQADLLMPADPDDPARPHLNVRNGDKGVIPHAGAVTVELPGYGTAVLSKAQ